MNRDGMRKEENGFTEKEKILIESFRVLNSDLELRTVIRNALGIMIRRFHGAGACLVLVDMHDFSLNIYTAAASSPEDIRTLPPIDENSVAGWESRGGQTVSVQRVDQGSEYASALKLATGLSPREILSAPLHAGGEFLGIVQAVSDSELPEFDSPDLDLLTIVAERIALTLRNAWILEEAVRALNEMRSLKDAGMALSSSLELDELLDKILDNLKQVVEYEIGIIYLVDPRSHSIAQVSTRGVPESDRNILHLKIGQGICGRVAETGKAIIVADVSSNTDYIPIRSQTKSEMAVPIKMNETLIGVFNVESDSPNAYNNHHLDLMSGFASLAAVSIERARMHEESIAARRFEHELSIARRIQMTFLPAGNPVIAGIDIAGINIPSAAVGGDYYDFIPIVENQYGIAIGDVSGKGIPAALIMAAFRASLKAEIRNNFAIRTILSKVNNLLYESIERDRFVTAVYGVLDSSKRVFTYSNAGHNQPIIRRASGHTDYLKEGGVALGVFLDSHYQEKSITLHPGDVMLFYTDGVTEVFNEEGKEFGVERLRQALDESSRLSAREIIDYIEKKTTSFHHQEREMDDLTMIVIKAL